jgi:hypothetical protein
LPGAGNCRRSIERASATTIYYGSVAKSVLLLLSV